MSTTTTIIHIPGPRSSVTLHESKGFSKKDLEKLISALAVLCYVINTDEFQTRIEEHTPSGETSPRFTNCPDDTWLVYKNFMRANELGTTGDDNELDFSLRYYNSWWSKVIGYTLPKQLWIWMNWKYHLKFTLPEMAGNLGHEQFHKLGYDHSSAKDYYSAPYAGGNIIQDIAEKNLDEALTWTQKVQLITVQVA